MGKRVHTFFEVIILIVRETTDPPHPLPSNEASVYENIFLGSIVHFKFKKCIPSLNLKLSLIPDVLQKRLI